METFLRRTAKVWAKGDETSRESSNQSK